MAEILLELVDRGPTEGEWVGGDEGARAAKKGDAR